MTSEHIKEVTDKTNKDISNFNKTLDNLEKRLKKKQIKFKNQKTTHLKKITEIQIREIDIIKLQNISDKKQQLKRNKQQIEVT